MDKLSVRPDEAARMLSVSRAYVYQLMQSGQLTSVKLGRARLIPVSALRAFLSAAADGEEWAA